MVTLEDINVAQTRISPFIHRTPIHTCNSLNELRGPKLYLNAIISKKQDLSRYVEQQISPAIIPRRTKSWSDTTSSGNHGAALALAATKQGADVRWLCQITLPE
ncbi:MAG: hypothetical protein Ct9H300mP9_0250 [Candidatus Neomarinimicrobiota bacterium]|nr:MAG: hypothetical protein Ct9H300mP9_0250 [Candidatus Neomarinimicrobiota bacterium]